MRTTIALLLVAYSSLCCGDEFDAIIFSGKVEWIKLSPIVDRSIGVDDDGTEWISNSCGFSETKFEIDEVYFGPEFDSITVAAMLGEWCKPTYPVSRTPIIVSAKRTDDGWWVGEEWEDIFDDPNGRLFIIPKRDSILFGCSMESWQTPFPYQVPYEGHEGPELPDWWLDDLVDEGYLRFVGEEQFIKSVIYIDRVAELAQSSECVNSAE